MLSREQIIKGLEYCANNDECVGVMCPYYTIECENKMPKDALALIKELTEENESLGALNEHKDLVIEGKLERISALERTVLKLTEENERLRKYGITYETPSGKQTMPNLLTLEGDVAECYKLIEDKIKLDTVQKMKELIEERLDISADGYSTEEVKSAVLDTVDQIAKEMVESEK